MLWVRLFKPAMIGNRYHTEPCEIPVEDGIARKLVSDRVAVIIPPPQPPALDPVKPAAAVQRADNPPRAEKRSSR